MNECHYISMSRAHIYFCLTQKVKLYPRKTLEQLPWKCKKKKKTEKNVKHYKKRDNNH